MRRARAAAAPPRPGRRTPLWQQRQRAAQLLPVASEYGSFPIVLETMRECLQDVFDVPGLVELMRDLRSRTVRVVEVETPQPSPFARSLLFGYVGAFLYEGDAPLAERRARRCRWTPRCWPSCSARPSCASCSTPARWPRSRRELQRLAADRRAARGGVADLLRLLGALTTAEALARGATPAWLAELEAARRAIRVRIAGEERWAAVEDAGRLRDALGVPLPVGVPEAFTEPVRDPLGDLVARYARTHGPFHAADCAGRLGLGVAVVAATLERLAATGRVAAGEFRPGGTGTEWCDAEVLRTLRRRSLAALRKEVEPVPTCGAGAVPAGLAGRRVAGRAAPTGCCGWSSSSPGRRCRRRRWRRLVLPSRVADYSPAMLDELTAAGEVIWAGAGALPGNDGWLALAPTDAADLLLPAADPVEPTACTRPSWRRWPAPALFFRTLSDRVGSTDDPALVAALWDLVWAGLVTNDTLAPLRALLGAGRGRDRCGGGRRRARATGAWAGRRCRPAPGRRRRPAGGRCCPTARPTRPGGRTRWPRRCSTGTAS